MPEDHYYGRVQLERGDVPDDEPVFVLRAKDQAAVPLLKNYRSWCYMAGSPPEHLALIDQDIATFEEYACRFHTQVPQSVARGVNG